MTYAPTGIRPQDLPDQQVVEQATGGRTVALLRRGDSIFAFAPKCPHAGAPLCGGSLDAAGRIVCPLHKYRFDPANGRNTSGEGYKLRVFPVELREDGIWVGLPD
jgi:nitrite reductase/ring-hydroxylating ferredoxin subunit